MTKKIIVGITLLAVFAGGAYYFLNTPQKSSTSQAPAGVSGSLVSPVRLAEVNGYITSVQGNEIVVANEIGVKEISGICQSYERELDTNHPRGHHYRKR